MKRIALQKSLDYLRMLIEHTKKGNLDRLPAVTQLAEDAGVSHVTMLRAIEILSSEGLINTRQGSGVFLKTASIPQPATSLQDRRPAADRIAQRIIFDISAGVYSPGDALPSVKQLQLFYGAGFRTMSAALHALESGNVIIRYKRGYAVSQIRSTRTASSMVLFMRGISMAPYYDTSTRSFEEVRTLQNECVKNGIGLSIIYLSYESRKLVPNNRKDLQFSAADLDGIVGFCILSRGLHDEAAKELLDQLSRCKKPVVFLDDSGFADESSGNDLTGITALITSGFSPTPGVIVGKYLNQLGHRHVAWIDTPGSPLWCVRRLEGIKQSLSITGSILHHVHAEIDTPQKLLNAQNSSLSLLKQGIYKNLDSFGEYKELLYRVFFGKNAVSTDRFIAHAVRQELRLDSIRSAVKDIIKQESITAWICPNDEIALTCLKILDENGISVPRKISVIGFDDTLDSVASGLTSYNFSIGSVARSTLNALFTYYRNPRKKQKQCTIIDLEGYLSIRQSTTQVKKK